MSTRGSLWERLPAGAPVLAQAEWALRRRVQLEWLEAVQQAAARAPAGQGLEAALEVVQEALAAEAALVVLLNPTTGFLEWQAASGVSARCLQQPLRVSEGILGWVTRTGRATRVDRLGTHPRAERLRPRAQSLLAVPLEVADPARGVLAVLADRECAFGPEEQSWLELCADAMARLIRQAWALEREQQRARMFQTLAELSPRVHAAESLEDALGTVTREAGRLMQARLCSLLLLDSTGQWLDLRAAWGAGPAYRNKPRLSVEESFVGVVVRRGRPMQIANVQTSSRYQHTAVARQEGLVALLSVPLIWGGHCAGVLNVYKDHVHVFSDLEVSVLRAFADLSAQALDRARWHERLLEVEEELRRNERLAALGLLAAEVAHEVRNPLTVIQMLYHSLNLQFPPHDPRAEDAAVLGRKIEQLNRIVDRILDLTRTGQPQFASVPINPLLEELARLVRHKLRQHRIELVWEPDPRQPRVWGDAGQLEQVFLNLVLNATQAMRQGGVLRLRTHARGKDVDVVVQDTGPGLSPEQRRLAFRSWLPSTRPGGTGLGLAIVGRIVEAHQGRVRAEAPKSGGTRIRVTLPAAPPAEGGSAGASSDPCTVSG
ncbi:MAG: GAF domain-containing protein [Verrucomicrobiota bacterium]|nr:GAF domain-containing protein [Limisphaera sp.]MDW8381683.1 GAF domain-containing protein [Verrucomicrobiota bacterium]